MDLSNAVEYMMCENMCHDDAEIYAETELMKVDKDVFDEPAYMEMATDFNG